MLKRRWRIFETCNCCAGTCSSWCWNENFLVLNIMWRSIEECGRIRFPTRLVDWIWVVVFGISIMERLTCRNRIWTNQSTLQTISYKRLWKETSLLAATSGQWNEQSVYQHCANTIWKISVHYQHCARIWKIPSIRSSFHRRGSSNDFTWSILLVPEWARMKKTLVNPKLDIPGRAY